MRMALRIAACVTLATPMTVGAQAMPGMDMTDHHHMEPPKPAGDGDPSASRAGTDLPAPDQGPPPPLPPADHAADRVYDPAAMAVARAALLAEHGGMTMRQLVFNLAELQIGKGAASYRWDAEGWWGGDINRLVVKSEGAGARSLDEAEVQALYSRAIGPFFDLQAGLRQDIGSGPRRTYAVFGVEGLAPYWFETAASLFLSTKGDLLGRAEFWYDQRITQRLIAQPRAELNFAAQDVPAQNIGKGLSSAELGLRLRYEVRREFAPYAGLAWERTISRMSAKAAQDSGVRFALGIKAWF